MIMWRQNESGYQNALIAHVAVQWITPPPWHGRHTGEMAVQERQHSNSSQAGHVSGVFPWAIPHSPVLEMILESGASSWDSLTRRFFALWLPPRCVSTLSYWTGQRIPRWWLAPSNCILSFCFAVPLLKLTICFFGHFWTCLHCCSRHVVDCNSFTSTTARSWVKFTGLC